MNTDDGENSYYYNLIKTAIKVREPPFEILYISVTHESEMLLEDTQSAFNLIVGDLCA